MIGNLTDAKIAAIIEVIYDEATWDAILTNAPEGWTLLGEGCYRRAFLSPENIVYKVEYGYSKGCNKNEATIFATYGAMVHGFRFAPCSLHDNGVLAMEYVEHKWESDYRSSLDLAANFMRTRFTYSDVKGKDGENFHADESGMVTLTDYAYDWLKVE